MTQQADLIVTKVPSASSFTVGTEVSWTITVTNLGPSTATAVELTDIIPADLQDPTYADGTGGTLSCPVGVCDVGTLAPGSSATVVVTGTVDADSTAAAIVNIARAGSDTPDPVEGNNEATSRVPLAALSHLVLNKTGPAQVTAGESVTWTVAVSNPAGPSTARAVQVADTLPAGITDVTVSAPAGVSCPDHPDADVVLTCDLPDLPAGGAPVILSITATVHPGYSGDTLLNSALATSRTPQSDPSSGDDSDQVTSAVQTRADLSIRKIGPAGAVVAGRTISWTVTVTNAGPSVARSVTIDDPPPAGITGLTGAWSGGTCDTPCAVGDLAPHHDIDIRYTGTVRSGYTGPTIANTATVGSATTDPETADNSATAITAITTSADVSLVKTVTPAPLVPGAAVTYSLAVHNTGPSDATGVLVSDPLPTELTAVSAVTTSGSCDVTGAQLSCDLGVLPSGAGATVTVRATLAAGVATGTISNTASVTATTPDPDLSNNTSTASAGTARADLSVTKTASTTFVFPSDPLVYTIDSANAGPGPARNTVVTDRIPDGTHLVSVTTTQGTCTATGLLVTCRLGTVPARRKATVVVTAKVDADRLAPLTNAAAAFSPDDADPSDNVDQVTTQVKAVADLALTKKITSGPVVAGGKVSWQLKVTNGGPASAPSVVITDRVPITVHQVSATRGCSVQNNTVTCKVGTLAAGNSFATAVTGTVDPAFRGSLSNTASVTSGVADRNPTNNTATVTSKVGADSLLIVTKEVDRTEIAVSDAVVYTITVAQHGSSTSAPVTVTEALPAAATVLAADASQGEYATGSRRWTIGPVMPGTPATLLLRVRLDTAGTVTNTVKMVENGNHTAASAHVDVNVTAPPIEPPPPPPPPQRPPLPNTGFPVDQTTVAGLLLLVGGALILLTSRRRRPQIPDRPGSG